MPSHAGLPPCHACQQPFLELIPAFQTLWQVSSDCLPVPPGGQLAICMHCGQVQKPDTPRWRETIGRIYQQYHIYHQSGGAEQAVFNPSTGESASRSLAILRKLTGPLDLPAQGRMLDVGCGNGALLAAMGKLHPQWQLVGTELSDQHRQTIEALPGVEGFHAGHAGDAPGLFNLIALIHVLEHIPNPKAFIQSLAPKLADQGQILIEVPDHQRNPFDLVIADHSSHFTPDSLANTLRQAGLGIALLERNIIPKELTAATTTGGDGVFTSSTASPQDTLQGIHRRIDWLRQLADHAQSITRSAQGPIAVFGTSIAATWLHAMLEGQIAYFVDEDPARLGRTFMDRPVYHPEDAQARSRPVLLALPDWLASSVADRLKDSSIDWLLPPKMPTDD